MLRSCFPGRLFVTVLAIVCLAAVWLGSDSTALADLSGRAPGQEPQLPDQGGLPQDPAEQVWPAPPGLNWHAGPYDGPLGTQATILVPEGYQFLDGPETRKLLELLENPTSGTEIGTVAPELDDWFVVFEFSDIGYVEDEDKDSLDADAILDSIRQGTEAANVERRQRGWATIEIVGWEHPPHYDPATNNLEWAVRATTEGQPIVNFNTRLLGRRGVMEVTLVASPERLNEILPTYKTLLAGYSFNAGQKYSEFQPGDKIAEYGLAALVAGGGLAIAAKTGLLAKLWKFVVVGVVAVGGFLAKLFGFKKKATSI